MTDTASLIAAAKTRVVDRNLNPLLKSLPSWVEGYRDHQVPAIEQAVDAFNRGVKVVVVDAPTGSGKTLIAETVRRLLKLRALYTCNTKSLQEQFVRDFPYARVLMGRANYPTERFPEQFHPGDFMGNVSCEDCTWTVETGCAFCTSKHRCPYEVAKTTALKADVAVLNTSYWLAEVNGPGGFRDHDLVVFDEADTLESELMGHVSVEISERRMEKWDWQPPAKVTVPSSWAEWIDEKLPLLEKMRNKLPKHPSDVHQNREAKYLDGLMEKLGVILEGLEGGGDGTWVYTGKGAEGSGRIAEKNKGRAVSFKPAIVDGLGKQYVWSRGKRFLLMSATIISAQQVLESLGWDGEYEVVSVPSTFPVENRKVVYSPAANMAAKNKERAWPEVAAALKRIVDEHRQDRILVHTVSYDLTRYLHEQINEHVERERGRVEDRGEERDRPPIRRVVSYSNAGGRDVALADFLRNERAVLLAPSLDRGTDLPGDSCRVQVIVKVPFPYLGDRQVGARLHSRGGDLWYRVQTIRSLVQMTGRAVRSAEDWAVTYVLDEQFEGLVMSRGRGLVPSWWRKAIEWPNRRP